jgi:hypothetical protein
VTNRLRLAALAAAVLAACGEDPAIESGLLLAQPSAVAVYRGLTPKRADVHHYVAIANAAANDLTILDAVDDSGVPAPVPLRTLVIPVPGRPALLVSADLGDSTPEDEKPDLLVAVSSGSSVLQVIATWIPGGGVACGGLGEGPCVDLGADVLALVALPSPAPGKARVAAALADDAVAVVTLSRSVDPGDEAAIELDPEAVETSTRPAVSSLGSLGFQPVALAIAPGDGSHVWAASPDLNGVARIDVDDASGAPSFTGTVLNALAPTRLVAAARLAERPDAAGEDGLDPLTWATTAPVERVYAVLDESSCGLDAEIACGLVALDPATGELAHDPAPVGTTTLPFRAPIPIPGRALALGATPPPVNPPGADPLFAGTYMRIATNQGVRATTGAAAVASSDGRIYYVDLGRWEIPSDQLVHANVGATITASATPGAPALDPASALTLTPGYTPTARWTVTYEGVLPGLLSRRAQIRDEGGPALALQVGEGGGASEVVRLFDPTLGVTTGDTVVIDVIDPAAPGTCTGQFEVQVAGFVEPASATIAGGAVRIEERDPAEDPTNGKWHSCFVDLTSPGATVEGLRATFRGGGTNPYVLVRGAGTAAVHVGRPQPGSEFPVAWTTETSFACPLPPAVPWPAIPEDVPPCDDACRAACQDLLRARLARRIGYVPESGAVDPFGPALAFTLAPVAEPARGLALVIDTREGRAPMRQGDPAGAAVNPGAVVPFDRSVLRPASGVRFFVPYASGVVLDASPTGRNSVAALR